ncbi:MscL family protein [Candidatus Uhrbacteria bacterium]|nr:MscL family protein [Candidatus Uhrbacteria bacterium]
MKDKVKKQVQGFVAFVREQGVMGLAIGFVLGGSTKELISSFVDDIIRPILNLLIGSTVGLEELAFYNIKYGSFLVSLIDFIMIAAVVYFVFKGFKLHRLDLKKETK